MARAAGLPQHGDVWGYVERTQAPGRYELGIGIWDVGSFEVYGTLDELAALIAELSQRLDEARERDS